ncbi:MAG: helix-turn-helix domain-containing protein [Chloroflexi bacterium]|nr:helix-turn-helix domain-containing protein [Chloroflexota bacterium]MCI0580193.1 helix-turn-helix domain-containing protein [Chloroflexota bacterium]MCI0646039.1 helix-turn-helix domain-containing protein [Chloroflexota bacterium]MCI0727381.1 helix-turn-helix domain-containing protein [Chloroflexota bacterium]
MNDVDQTRAKILGVLIQDACVYAGRSVDDCAEVLGMTVEEFGKVQRGEQPLSLPELEILAIYLKVPMAHFWGNETVGQERQPDYSDLLALRRRIIGTLLRQARLQAKRTTQDVANEIGVGVERVNEYELGETSVPLFDLERMAKYLGVSLDYFSDDKRGPLGRHEAEQKMQKRFNNLPPKVKAFVTEPINLSYLETAMRLSEMNVQKLRSIAEGILDITF